MLFKVDTKDLYIYPLNSEELLLLINDLPQLEKNLNVTFCSERLNEVLVDYIQSQFVLGMTESENLWIWFTHWLIIRKLDNKVVGTFMFKGKPYLGKVEIGYGIFEEFRHKGYMTSVLAAIFQWINKQQPKVKSIVAETKHDNVFSQKLLLKCGFEKDLQTDYAIIFKKRLE